MDVRDLLSGRLAAGEVMIVDGGMGTQLQAEGADGHGGVERPGEPGAA